MIGVVDSSVAVKWYVAEQDSDLAATLLGVELAAPELIRAEVANALWKKVRKGEARQEQVTPALPHLAASVILLPSDMLAEQALEVAFHLGHPVYDCFFLVLAKRLQVPLITSDARLYGRTRGSHLAEAVMMLPNWVEAHG